MKNVLIIAYHYPPLETSASRRPYSWVKNFHEFDILPTVISKNWQGNENKKADYIASNNLSKEIIDESNYKEIRIPYQKLEKLSKTGIFRKIQVLFYSLFGYFDFDFDAYFNYKSHVEEELKSKKYDAIIVTAPPINAIRLGYQMAKKYRLQLFIDYRDLWDNNEASLTYVAPFSNRIINKLTKFYLKKWHQNAGITTISEPFLDIIQTKVGGKQFQVIKNGYFEEDYLTESLIKENTHFTFSSIGTIYEGQKMQNCIEGIQLFLANTGATDILFNFIGLDNQSNLVKELKEKLPEQFIKITERIDRKKAIKLMRNSDVLFYPAWSQHQGIYSGKIFEYLGAKKNILVSPSDNGIIEDLINDTKAGKIAASPKEFEQILTNFYRQWKKNGTITYEGVTSLIEGYSRKSQAKIFAKFISTNW